MPIRNRIRTYRSKALYLYNFYREAYRDSRRYLKASKSCLSGKEGEGKHLESDIIRRYHIVEKGLCMPDFRPRFGIQIVTELVEMLDRWRSGHPGESSPQMVAAEQSLKAYFIRHRDLGIDVSDLIPERYRTKASGDGCGNGSVKPYPELGPGDREALARSIRARSSLRDFDRKRIPVKETILEAVRTALACPSVCNRQTCRVHVVNGELGQRVLGLQNGNRGFGQTIPAVLVVTSDMRYFIDIIERYQAWIDGGIFAMNLLLGLQAEGMGAVPLNWSVLNERDDEMRKLLGIPAHERIILLVGCGYPVPKAMVTDSARRDPGQIVVWH